MQKQYLILNGYPRSGKNTFADFLSKHTSVYETSSIDIIKDVCKILGWDGVKDAKGRLALAKFKQLANNCFDTAYFDTKKHIEEFNQTDKEIFITYVREPKEIARLVKDFGFKTVFIVNHQISHELSKAKSDVEVEQYRYDYYINNDGTLEELEEQAINFLEKIRSDTK